MWQRANTGKTPLNVNNPTLIGRRPTENVTNNKCFKFQLRVYTANVRLSICFTINFKSCK